MSLSADNKIALVLKCPRGCWTRHSLSSYIRFHPVASFWCHGQGRDWVGDSEADDLKAAGRDIDCQACDRPSCARQRARLCPRESKEFSLQKFWSVQIKEASVEWTVWHEVQACGREFSVPPWRYSLLHTPLCLNRRGASRSPIAGQAPP